MPECLHPLGDQVFGGDLTPLQTALETALPDVSTRVLAIFEWFGAGKGGTWSNFPSYEWMPGKLLLEYPTTGVVQALTSTTLTPALAEGAARHFGGWEFRGHRKEELNLVPTELKKQLLQHTLEHSDRENSGDAMSAFGDVLD